eukprot:scaffold4079_cov167-Amphora_coffeaeformis.AAC.16
MDSKEIMLCSTTDNYLLSGVHDKKPTVIRINHPRISASTPWHLWKPSHRLSLILTLVYRQLGCRPRWTISVIIAVQSSVRQCEHYGNQNNYPSQFVAAGALNGNNKIYPHGIYKSTNSVFHIRLGYGETISVNNGKEKEISIHVFARVGRESRISQILE